MWYTGSPLFGRSYRESIPPYTMLAGAHPLLLLALVLLAGFIGGALVRFVRLPSVTGQILAGMAIGGTGLGILSHQSVLDMSPITHFALGLVAVTVGTHLRFRRLRNAFRRLSILALMECTITPVVVFGCAFAFPNISLEPALLLAALAISTAPATIIAVVKETRSKGVFVKTLLAAVALNNITCILLFEVAHSAARVALDTSGTHAGIDIVLTPFLQLLSTAGLGGAIGLLLVFTTRHIVRADLLTTLSIIVVLLTAGLANYLHVSELLACLFLGVTLTNAAPDKPHLGDRAFVNFEPAIYAIFFTLAGAELDFGYLIPAGLMALVVVLARIIGKVASATTAMKLAGATDAVRRHLGIALIPQAGVAVGLMLSLRDDPLFAPMWDLFLAIALTSVLMNEIIGPIMTRLALVRSGDFGKDRARLIDFLHEENIMVAVSDVTKDELFRQLCDLLIKSNNLAVDREELLASVLERENELSTCIGGGLAIPHGILRQGDKIAGAMALSPRGLDFAAPDGRPVRCVVLLATPNTQRNRHLEVLAALTDAIGLNRSVQDRLVNAKSAAHAYEIIYAEESEGFNYFLDDDSADTLSFGPAPASQA